MVGREDEAELNADQILAKCRRRDSNPHASRRHPLKMVCLPIPPLRRGLTCASMQGAQRVHASAFFLLLFRRRRCSGRRLLLLLLLLRLTGWSLLARRRRLLLLLLLLLVLLFRAFADH